jgi:hypothetical protein
VNEMGTSLSVAMYAWVKYKVAETIKLQKRLLCKSDGKNIL